MALRLVQVNFKARDDSALGRFWAEVIGWGVSSEGSGVTDDLAKLRSCEVAKLRRAAGVGPYPEFVRMPDITVWTRIHLDLRPYPLTTNRQRWPGRALVVRKRLILGRTTCATDGALR